jgi:hypothetical protein
MVSSTEAFPGKGEATWMTISTPEQISASRQEKYIGAFTIECTSEVVFSDIINFYKLEGGMTDAPEGRNFLASGGAVVKISVIG